MLADSGAAALVSTSVLADGLAGVLAQTPVQHVISVDTLDELPASPFGSMSYPDDLETAWRYDRGRDDADRSVESSAAAIPVALPIRSASCRSRSASCRTAGSFRIALSA